MQAYTRRDAYGDMGWNRPVNTNLLQGGPITIARNPTTGFYTAHEPARTGHDEVRTPRTSAPISRNARPSSRGAAAGPPHGLPHGQSEDSAEAYGCVKARVTGALPSNTCCRHSADRSGPARGPVDRTPLLHGAKVAAFPGDPSVANLPQFMWLRAVLAGADVDALKAERRRHKRVDAATFYGLCPEAVGEADMAVPAERSSTRSRLRRARCWRAASVVKKSFSDIFPRVRADPPVLSYNKEVSRSKARSSRRITAPPRCSTTAVGP